MARITKTIIGLPYYGDGSTHTDVVELGLDSQTRTFIDLMAIISGCEIQITSRPVGNDYEVTITLMDGGKPVRTLAKLRG